MTRPLIILGTGGSAYDVLDVIEGINAGRPTWDVQGFLDDAKPSDSKHLGLPVLALLRDAGRFADAMFVNVIGSDKSFPIRPRIVASTGLPPDRFATLVHPGASVSSRANLGRGVYVNAGASVAGNVTIGDQVALGPNCAIGHDTTIGAYTLVAPAAVVSGFVRIGSGAYVGAGAVIRQQVRIGAGALVGMGAVVLRDVGDAEVVVGNPAKPLRRKSTP